MTAPRHTSLTTVGAADTTTHPRPGRPRDPQIDTAVLETTLAALDEHGYGNFRLEQVARRAGTTKPAIYRRWPSRQHLVLAALAMRLREAEPPDTGCTLCDLNECLMIFVVLFQRIRADVLGSLFADCAKDPGLHAAFMTTLFDPPRAAVGQTLDHAMARGDLRPDTDRELTVDLLSSLVHYRALFAHAPTTDEDVQRAVEALLRGIATDYEELVEHSRRVTGDPQIHHHWDSPPDTGAGNDRANTN